MSYLVKFHFKLNTLRWFHCIKKKKSLIEDKGKTESMLIGSKTDKILSFGDFFKQKINIQSPEILKNHFMQWKLPLQNHISLSNIKYSI